MTARVTTRVTARVTARSPPTSYTSPLFEMHAYPSSGSLDALMMPHTSSAMGFDFHYGDHTAEVLPR